ncbi:hypothetical protein GCM10010439_28120 [Actinocorallia aurantiaca]|uniref:Uncharacterized protein n=1 Tax=Actinocorallia aurantiaca TaxID=46204 RepID=A0ABN3U7Q9_9ACTN
MTYRYPQGRRPSTTTPQWPVSAGTEAAWPASESVAPVIPVARRNARSLPRHRGPGPLPRPRRTARAIPCGSPDADTLGAASDGIMRAIAEPPGEPRGRRPSAEPHVHRRESTRNRRFEGA